MPAYECTIPGYQPRYQAAVSTLLVVPKLARKFSILAICPWPKQRIRAQKRAMGTGASPTCDVAPTSAGEACRSPALEFGSQVANGGLMDDALGIANGRWVQPSLVALAALAFFAGYLVAASGAPPSGSSAADEYRAWALLIGASTAAGIWVTFSAWRRFRLLHDSAGIARSDLLASVVVVAEVALVVVAGSLTGRPDYGALDDATLTILVSVILVGSAGLLPLVLIDAVRQTSKASRPAGMVSVAQLLALRGILDRTLEELSVLVTLGIVSTAVLRRATLAAAGDFSESRVMLAGLQATVLLGIVYWPAEGSLSRCCQHHIDAVTPPEQEFDRIPGTAWLRLNDGAVATRKHLADLLGIQPSPISAIQRRTTIALPLIVSLLEGYVE